MTDPYDRVVNAVSELARLGEVVTSQSLGRHLGCSACSTRKYLIWGLGEGLLRARKVRVLAPGHSPTDPQREFMEVEAYERTEVALA